MKLAKLLFAWLTAEPAHQAAQLDAAAPHTLTHTTLHIYGSQVESLFKWRTLRGAKELRPVERILLFPAPPPAPPPGIMQICHKLKMSEQSARGDTM